MILTLVLWAVLVVCLDYGLYQWLQIARHMFAMTSHYKPGVNKWGSETLFNPLNGLWRRSLLTESGLEHVNACYAAAAKFVAACLLPFFLAYIIEVSTGVQLISR